jgi:hypothetical protein
MASPHSACFALSSIQTSRTSSKVNWTPGKQSHKNPYPTTLIDTTMTNIVQMPSSNLPIARGLPIHVFITRLVCFAICVGVTLIHFVSQWFLLFLLFVAVNYFQSSFPWGICPPTIAFRRLGWSGHDPSDPLIERVYFFGIGKPAEKVEPDVKDAVTAATH